MGTPLGPRYIPYNYMDPLGKFNGTSGKAPVAASSASGP